MEDIHGRYSEDRDIPGIENILKKEIQGNAEAFLKVRESGLKTKSFRDSGELRQFRKQEGRAQVTLR